MSHFVKVNPVTHRLELNGQPFRIIGANCYHPQSHGADSPKRLEERRKKPDDNLTDSGGRANIQRLIKSAADHDINVLRIWAHNDGNGWKAIQKNGAKEVPGSSPEAPWYEPNIDEDGVDGLDWVIDQAAKNNIKLIMSLTNYWPEFGGLTQYAEWAGVGGGDPKQGDPQARFYRSGPAQSRYKAYIQTLLSRNNPYRNMQYKDDPAILAWSIVNEPRDKGDKSGNTLDRWIRDTSDFVRSQDGNHLITVDTEGFFKNNSSGFPVHDLNPWQLEEGCNFLTNAAHPNIDFACCHMYHDLWGLEGSQDKKRLLPWTDLWLNAHLQACQEILKKPLVLSEFSHTEVGTGHEKYDARRQYLQHVYGWLEKHMKNDNWVAGSCVWMICGKYYRKDNDSEKRFIAIDGDGKDGLQEIISHAQAFNDSRSLHAEQ